MRRCFGSERYGLVFPGVAKPIGEADLERQSVHDWQTLAGGRFRAVGIISIDALHATFPRGRNRPGYDPLARTGLGRDPAGRDGSGRRVMDGVVIPTQNQFDTGSSCTFGLVLSDDLQNAVPKTTKPQMLIPMM